MALDPSAAAKAALSSIIQEEASDLPSASGQIVVARHLRRHAAHPFREKDLPKRLSELKAVARHPMPKPAAELRGDEPWSDERIALVQQVWGKGFTSPGGTEAILKMIEPLKLQRRMRVLELGAGLGGAGRVLARRTGAHVTGLECNPRLAEAGMALSAKAWLTRKAPVKYLGGPGLNDPLGSYDCFIARNFLFAGARRAWMLRLVGAVLNRSGQLLITDFVVPRPGERTAAIKRWLAIDPEASLPWATGDYANRLADMGLHVRIDDMTETMCASIKRSWSDYLLWLRAFGNAKQDDLVLVEEVERWARRVQLLESGELEVCRIHAAKKLTDLPPVT